MGKSLPLSLPPTDVALWLRLGRCDRLLALKRAEREDQDERLFSDASVLPQTVSPLLSATGRAFEKKVEDAARATLGFAIDCRDTSAPDGDSPNRRDNDRLVHLSRSLSPGKKTVVFQVRLEVQNLWGWRVLGDLDLIRMERTLSGELRFLITDSKASGHPKVEHYVQLAYYREMVLATLAGDNIVPASVDIGVVYRGDRVLTADARHQEAAKRLLGLSDAYLAVAPNPSIYVTMAHDLVASTDAPVRIAMNQSPEQAAFHFGLVCVGCRYTAWCCREACARLDLSLLPHLTMREKKALLGAGVCDIPTLAALKEEGNQTDRTISGGSQLTIAPGKEETVQKIALSPAGPRLDTLILHAQAVRHRERRYLRADDSSHPAFTAPSTLKTEEPK